VTDYLQSLLLGIVEGLTEFLPVSSTAHLRLTQGLLHIDLDNGFWKMYAIVIQLGAILALPVFFREKIGKFLSTFPKGENDELTPLTHPVGLTLIAFVVTAIPAYLLNKVIGKNLESPHVMALALLIGGVVMWIVDLICRSPFIEKIEDMGILRAVWVGAVQILSAVFPGTSRSMCTIAAGQLAGLTRATALEFSFFVSIPTMVVATGYTLLKTLHPGHQAAETAERLTPITIDSHGWVILGIGFVVSFIVALGVIAWFMSWVRRRGFAPFAIYRILLGAYLLSPLNPHPAETKPEVPAAVSASAQPAAK
jgi:undecaprenyl-diphosphatase